VRRFTCGASVVTTRAWGEESSRITLLYLGPPPLLSCACKRSASPLRFSSARGRAVLRVCTCLSCAVHVCCYLSFLLSFSLSLSLSCSHTCLHSAISIAESCCRTRESRGARRFTCDASVAWHVAAQAWGQESSRIALLYLGGAAPQTPCWMPRCCLASWILVSVAIGAAATKISAQTKHDQKVAAASARARPQYNEARRKTNDHLPPRGSRRNNTTPELATNTTNHRGQEFKLHIIAYNHHVYEPALQLASCSPR